MTTLQIDSNDKKSIKELLDIAKNKFHLDIFIVDDIDSSKAKVETKTKWGKFADKMDGIFTPEIVQHISTSRKEARDKIKKKLLSLSEDDIVSVSIITLYELSYGLNTFNCSSENKYIFEDSLRFIQEYLDIYPLDMAEVDIFGILKSEYKKSTGIAKTAIKKNDLDFLILATAINHHAILVSNDAIFSKIVQTSPNLKYENWTK